MQNILKNIAQSEIITLKEQVDYLKGQIVSKTLVQNESVSMTLFAFDQNEEISTHESTGDAVVTCLDGVGEVVIDDQKYLIKEGETIVMPANRPHSVYGKECFKMLLTVVFPK